MMMKCVGFVGVVHLLGVVALVDEYPGIGF